MKPPKFILPIIVTAQFFCTSLWFAGNGVMNELTNAFNLETGALANLTAAVQLGFIVGTLVFALLSIADRYSPSKVFLVSALLGAGFNAAVIIPTNTFTSILILRFFTGFFLAGIYPVGMKIAADYYDKGLGKSLGYLVGALVIGTALPHLLKDIKGELPWELVLITTSALACIGGLLMVFFVPNGPYRKTSQSIKFTAISNIFKARPFRAAAFGYFGHMWELYTFWAFVPLMLELYAELHANAYFNIPLLSFLIIAIGCLGCIVAGYLSSRIGTKRLASMALLSSGACCLVAPLLFSINAPILFIGFLLFWGFVVIADSPLYSTLVAQKAPAQLKGTALTIVNSIGFFLTIVSIQLITFLSQVISPTICLMVLAIGPILGLISLSAEQTKS